MEWQPIETAPNDGDPVLIYQPSERDDGVTMYVCVRHINTWIEAAGEEYGTWNPTHWMPLPEPPK